MWVRQIAFLEERSSERHVSVKLIESPSTTAIAVKAHRKEFVKEGKRIPRTTLPFLNAAYELFVNGIEACRSWCVHVDCPPIESWLFCGFSLLILRPLPLFSLSVCGSCGSHLSEYALLTPLMIDTRRELLVTPTVTSNFLPPLRLLSVSSKFSSHRGVNGSVSLNFSVKFGGLCLQQN